MGEVVNLHEFQKSAGSVPQVIPDTSPIVPRKSARDSFSPAAIGLGVVLTLGALAYGGVEFYEHVITPARFADPGIGPGPTLFRP